ncbi:MAG: hypothetical protein GX652_11035 [Burkholderiaceae bacterium]|nr:hypothetical protein [Burkholderiaceae bacterium]
MSVLAPALVLLAFVLAGPAAASAAERGRGHAEDASALPAKTGGWPLGKATTAPSHAVREGDGTRPLWLDSRRIVEFPGDGGSPTIRAARPGELDGSRSRGRADAKGATAPPAGGQAVGAAPAVSPLFEDAAGHPRALPGGVIVGLKEALPADEARAQLAADGLQALRQISARMWLVDAPTGLASLDLANELQASGRYDFVQPNWWKPRTTK